VPESFILQVMNVVQQCPQHTFVVLTKRPEINVDNSKSCDKV
jgi:protein gp37